MGYNVVGAGESETRFDARCVGWCYWWLEAVEGYFGPAALMDACVS